METLETATDFDSLWESMLKCRRTVSWKTSVKSYMLNGVERTVELQKEIGIGYAPRVPRTVEIYYPKRRQALSITLRDRVFQRALNDLILYPEMSRHFILDNCSCQTGKGTAFARERIRRHLRRHYIHHGADGWIVQIDIHGYYPHMNHDAVHDCFARYLPRDVMSVIDVILKSQEVGGGYNPGSQMIQIAGIALLDPLDHYIKERLHVHHYARYMDDFLMILPTYSEAEGALCETVRWLNRIGFTTNPDKTQIKPLSSGFDMLGSHFRLTESGRIIQTLLPQNVRHQRIKLVRMAHKGVAKDAAAVSMQCWEAHAAEGRNKRAISNIRTLFTTLYKEAQNA